MDHTKTTFLSGCAASHEAAFFAKELDEFVEQDRENSSFLMLFKSNWYKADFGAAWTAISMATTKPANKDRLVLAVSPRGAYWELEPAGPRESHGQIPKAEYPLRALSAIDDVVYACGMGRTVLRRKNRGAWDEIGPGTSKADGESIVGFESLAAFSADEMYAVGWRGEIWQLRRNRWRRLDSPVSVKLNSVFCASDGNVYIVGDDGTLLRGRNDVWEVLSTGVADNLMDVAFHDGTLYVTTDFQILKLAGGAMIPEDAFADADDTPGTCLHLLPATGVLWSMGTKDLFRLHGGTWERVV
jgi:hypothetical protein